MPVDKNNSLRRYQSAPFLQEITATHLNEAVDSLQSLREDYSRRIGVPSDDGGRHLNWTIGVITSKGPNNESDSGTHLYWVKTQRVISTVKIGDPIELEDETAPGIWEYVQAANMAESKDSHSLDTDESVFVKLYRLQGSNSAGCGHRVFWAGGTSSSTVPLRIGSAYAGRGWYGAAICTPPTAYEWTPNIQSGVDVTTTYTSGVAFTNGDYAKNLSDSIVYHRESGAWVNAAGHRTTSDPDVTTDLTTQKTTFIPTGTAAAVIACNLFEATTGNDAGLVSPLATGELCLGIPWYTTSTGTLVYLITGRFRMIDGSNYMVPLYNAGQYAPDWPRAH